MELLDHYIPVLDAALGKFCDFWWPCEYIYRGRRCVNTKEGHAKGHQDARARPFGNGEYQSGFNAHIYRPTWHLHLRSTLSNTEKLMKPNSPIRPSHRKSTEQVEASKIHLHNMSLFYHALGGAERFLSNATCLSCLGDMPGHPLICGHVICSQCVRTFGRATSDFTFRLKCCPLHYNIEWGREVHISLKPHLAGVRVLSLDG